jgi:anti-sigma B factor antagonist
MRMNQRQREGIYILDLEGSLMAGEACAMLRERITQLAKEPEPRVVLNLKEVDYIDSSGLGTLVSCFTLLQRAKGGFRILNPSERNMELIVLTKLSSVFDVFDDEQEALNSCFPDRANKKFDILAFVTEQRKLREGES